MPDEKLPDSAFRPPDDGARDKIEIETAWAKEKAARQAGATIAKQKKKSPAVAIIVAIVLLVGGLGALGYFVMKKDANAKHDKVLPATDKMVSIEIRSNLPATVMIDGHKAGRAPMIVHMPKRTSPLMIQLDAPGLSTQTQQVTPDHDLTVDFVFKK